MNRRLALAAAPLVLLAACSSGGGSAYESASDLQSASGIDCKLEKLEARDDEKSRARCADRDAEFIILKDANSTKNIALGRSAFGAPVLYKDDWMIVGAAATFAKIDGEFSIGG